MPLSVCECSVFIERIQQFQLLFIDISGVLTLTTILLDILKSKCFECDFFCEELFRSRIHSFDIEFIFVSNPLNRDFAVQ